MLEWNVRILLFTSNLDEGRFRPNKFRIFRKGSEFLEVDLRFSNLDSGLEYVSGVLDVVELCIFNRGESIPLNSLEEKMNGINEGFFAISEEKYWIAHEIFEDYWKYYKDNRSKFFHGIVLMCVSMVHAQMSHPTNAARIFEDSKHYLTPFIEEAIGWNFYYPLNKSILEVVMERATSLPLV